MRKPDQHPGGIWMTLRRLMADVYDSGAIIVRAVHQMRDAAPPGEMAPLHPDIRFEESDIDARGTAIAGYAVLLGALFVACLLYFFFAFLSNYRARLSPPPLPIEAHGTPLPPQPRIQESPRRDLEDLRAYEDSVLNHYAWVDQQKGVVGLPIERAMELIVQRGIPPQKAPDNLKLFPPSAGDRGVGFVGKVAPEPR